MTRKTDETSKERNDRFMGYLCGIIELPFRFEDLSPEMQARFPEVPPLPTYKIEDVKPWVPIEKVPSLSTLQEYDALEVKPFIEDEELLHGIDDEEIPAMIARLQKALKDGLSQ